MRIPLPFRALVATVLPLTVGGLGPVLLTTAGVWRGIPAWRLVFAVPMAAGLALLAWSILLFAIEGQGTLAPIDPPTVFVARGPYRVTRNPMYLGVLLWLTGLASLTGARSLGWDTCIVAAGFHTFVTLVEEPGLRRRFGASYEAYTKSVPRWLGLRRGTRAS